MSRGKPKNIRSLTLTGNVYLKYEHDENISFQKGDVMFAVNNEEKFLLHNYYFETGYAGYFKIYIYDGYTWCHLIEKDFFEEKENYFSKNEQPIDNYNLSSELIANKGGTVVYRTYREHYTTYLHEMNEFKGKKGQMDRKKKK